MFKRLLKKYSPTHRRISSPFYRIEIVGTCNLACPSCPSRGYAISGTPDSEINTSKLMDLTLFKNILKKIAGEKTDAGDTLICLYTWFEPTLHPKIGEYIRIVKSHGFRCNISSNLNIEKYLEDIVVAGPDLITISCSGFTKDSYGVTHAGGDVNTFIANMTKLRYFLDLHKSRTRVCFSFHLYKTNAEQLPLLKFYAKLLKFDHTGHDNVAYMTGLEDVLNIKNGAEIPHGIKNVMSKMIFSVDDWTEMTRPFSGRACPQIEEQVVIDVDGAVRQCCAVYDRKHNVAANYLDISRSEYQDRRNANPICNSCFKAGHPYYELAKKTRGFSQRINSVLPGISSFLPRETSSNMIKNYFRKVPILRRAARWMRSQKMENATDLMP